MIGVLGTGVFAIWVVKFRKIAGSAQVEQIGQIDPTRAENIRLVDQGYELQKKLAQAEAEATRLRQLQEVNLLVAMKTPFRLEDVRYRANPDGPYRNLLDVILKNTSGGTINVWAPVWENSTGELPAQDPLGSWIFTAKLGYPRKPDELEAWEGPIACIEIGPGITVQCSVGLLEPPGQGIKWRLDARNHRTGTLIVPLKIEGSLAVQKIEL